MSMFVDRTIIDVFVDGDEANVIRLKSQLAFKERSRLKDELARLRLSESGDEDGQSVSFQIGSYELALAKAYIAGWDGPAFIGTDGKAVACTSKAIDALNTEEPLFKAAIAKIGDLNTPKPSPVPN